MTGTLRERWRTLENGAIARGRYFGMTAAGQSLNQALAPLIMQYARGAVLDAGAGRLSHRPAILRCRNVRQYVGLDYVVLDSELGVVADLVTGLPFADGTFDSVVCSQVLEHVTEPQAALGEMARVLTVGGTLLLSVPHLSFVHGAPEDYYRYTRYGVSHLLRRVGLEPLVVKPAGGLLSLLGTPASMALLLATNPEGASGPVRWLGSALNRGLIAGSLRLETRFDRERLFALNIVAAARKPESSFADRRRQTSQQNSDQRVQMLTGMSAT